MAEVVYLLCAVTSVIVAVLLLRGYLAGRVRLLLWSGLCFVGLAANNVLLFLDHSVLEGRDLALARAVTNVAGLLVLVVGLILDADR
jgi:hypothetical protein